MAWTAANPTVIGNATRIDHWAAVWDNGLYLYDFINARSIFVLEAVAPAGWSIISGCEDGLLAVKGGAVAYNVAGGTKLQGTWTQLGHTHTGGAHTHATAGFQLLLEHMPAHTHEIDPAIFSAGGGTTWGGSPGSYATNNVTTSEGSDQSHSHGDTGSGGDASATGSSVSANTWRPVANVGILIEKT